METQAYDNSIARKSFSRVGVGLFVFAAVTIAAQIIISAIYQMAVGANPAIADMAWLSWLIQFLPIYLIGMPCGLAVMARMPSQEGAKEQMTFGRFVMFFFMCLPVMYIGNIIGTIFSCIVSGGTAENPLNDLVMENSFMKVLFVALIGPVCEELVFRKFTIDKTLRYGEPAAILFSGVTFALFHMNFFQFFYAFGLGVIFAYVYLRTKNLLWPCLLHIMINTMGSVIAPALVSSLDLELLTDAEAIAALTEAELAGILPALLGYFAYSGFIMLGTIVGLILIIVRWKHLHFERMPEDLPKSEIFRTSYLNVGFLIFFAICFVMIVLNIVLPLLA